MRKDRKRQLGPQTGPHEGPPDPGHEPHMTAWLPLLNWTKAWKQLATKRADYSRACRRDEAKLWQMGYRQELPRTMTFFNNASCGLSVLSYFALVESYGSQGMTYGGPVVVIWGWIVVSAASLCVALCLAELLSAYPTSGGLYYQAFVLAPHKWRAVSCWFTGWLNLMGQATFTATLEVALSRFLQTLITLRNTSSSGDSTSEGVVSNNALLGIMAGLLAIHAAMNCMGQRVVAGCITISGLWHIIGGLTFCVFLLLMAPDHQPSSFVWGAWMPNTDIHGISSPAYIVLVGLLMSQWTIMGYDACVHLSEETMASDRAASKGLVACVAGCSCLGLIFLLSLTYSAQTVDDLLALDGPAQGTAAAQVVWAVFVKRYGSGQGSLPLLFIPFVGLFLCAFTSMTASSRMIYAFSRDGAMLGSRWWSQLEPNTRQPILGTWFMALLAFLIGLPTVYDQQVFQAISAASVVGLSLSYGIPIFFRLYSANDTFMPGPFKLGIWHRPLAIIAIIWIGLVTIVFCLPPMYPITASNVNYAPVLLLGILLLALITWCVPVCGGRHWFTGPIPNVASMQSVKHLTEKNKAPVQVKQTMGISAAMNSSEQAKLGPQADVQEATNPSQPFHLASLTNFLPTSLTGGKEGFRRGSEVGKEVNRRGLDRLPSGGQEVWDIRGEVVSTHYNSSHLMTAATGMHHLPSHSYMVLGQGANVTQAVRSSVGSLSHQSSEPQYRASVGPRFLNEEQLRNPSQLPSATLLHVSRLSGRRPARGSMDIGMLEAIEAFHVTQHSSIPSQPSGFTDGLGDGQHSCANQLNQQPFGVLHAAPSHEHDRSGVRRCDNTDGPCVTSGSAPSVLSDYQASNHSKQGWQVWHAPWQQSTGTAFHQQGTSTSWHQQAGCEEQLHPVLQLNAAQRLHPEQQLDAVQIPHPVQQPSSGQHF